jgi:signal transduction histidine kinase
MGILPMSQSTGISQRIDRVSLIATLVFQGLVILALLAIPFLGYQYISTPFIGAFIGNTMLVNNAHPEPVPANWDLTRQGAQPGDQLLALDNTPVTSYSAMRQVVTKHTPGESIPVSLRQVDGSEVTYQVTLSNFSFSDQVSYFFIPFLSGLAFLIIAWWILSLRRAETSGRAFAIFASSAALWAGGLFNVYTTHQFLYLWTFAVPLIGAGLIHLGLVFPQEARFMRERFYLRWVSYGVALLLAIYGSVGLYNLANPNEFITHWRVSYAFVGLSILAFLGIMVYRRFTASSPVVRQQSGTILIGAVIGFGPMALWFLTNIFSQQNFNSYILLFLIVFPLTTAYTVQRARLLRTDYLVSRGMAYTLLIVIALVGYIALTFALSMIFSLVVGSMLPANSPLLIGLTVILLVLVMDPLRIRLQQYVDAVFFRGQRAYQDHLQTFTRQLTSTVQLPEVLKVLREQVMTTLLPNRLHIYIYDTVTDTYIAAPDDTGRPTSDIRFASSSVLPGVIRNEHLPLFFDREQPPMGLEPEKPRLMLLGAILFIAMPGKDRLVGWLALGERLSGESYATSDLTFLESLCDQASVALERAQIVTNMEQRVHEMNVLSRVAQGINITLTFDDILELIYAQASQVVPGSDFRLTLYNHTGQYFYYGFYLENDERIRRYENSPLPIKSTLDQEVVNFRRPLITQDYLRECQILGVTPSNEGMYAWVGVPLNAGAETIGALSMGSRDPSILYSPRQVELLQAIADQAAGAIVKARLLQESERRALQLSTLNTLTRQLTSTLEIEPLLKNLLESAVSILNCEAGTLFLIDEQTDELVFRVTVGAGATLVGQRLPAGSGVVGKAVTTREAVIVNEVQASPTWNARTDQQTGFVTRAILAVPMEVKDRIIGVIETINKMDGLPFTDDDQNLLTAFAGQAAVAIDNARLYTLTDQELSARVEELSVMQRIDRELNASLEVERAMRITLDWAMRQSSAEAGFIGILQEKGVRLMAQQGYGESLAVYEKEELALDHPALVEALNSGQPQRITLSADEKEKSFLSGTRSQLVIPIRREAKVIGLFVLESTQPDQFAEQAQGFLSRLSDHAAIAISNAQLYGEVQQANIAKSEFVSFVAHELKNPMTSIKGYAELLAAGAVGSINEMQTNFLSTIRSNIERMKTIVEDLNDNSKIEAGRLRLEYKAVDISEAVDDVIRSTKAQIEEKKQTIEVQLRPDLPKIWADRNRLIQIIVNLVSNAHKYTQESGHILVTAEKSLNLWDPGGAREVVHIWVKDDGIGISPEDQVKIFQKFFRSDDDQARRSPGTGLGLNITRSLIEMMGGKIWFESEFRKGTSFHFTVPISEG